VTTELESARAAFIDASFWHGSLSKAESIIAAHPEIASSDVHTAAVLGDDAAVRRFLTIDRAHATAKGGPRNVDALTYLCFSTYLAKDRSRSDAFVRAATALLDAGVDPWRIHSDRLRRRGRLARAMTGRLV
jgi:hypothetical protein